MATIDQLRMMTLGNNQSLEKGQTTKATAGNFKKVLKSVMEVPKDLESFLQKLPGHMEYQKNF